MKIASIVLITCLLTAAPANSQITAKRTGSSCIDLREDRLTVGGLLKLESFPGPPNYESVEAGDAEEKVLMIELPDIDCVDDQPGEEVGDSELFMSVHVYSSSHTTLTELNKLVGHKVIVDGQGFKAHTAHHRSALVVDVTKITEAR